MSICNTIFGSFLSGLFGVLGGSIPIAVIISMFFYRTRQNFRKALPSEEKMLEKLHEILKQEKENLVLIEEVSTNEKLKQEIFECKIQTQQKVFDYEFQIIKQESWIDKTSGLWEWAIYTVSSRYFKDYFKK